MDYNEMVRQNRKLAPDPKELACSRKAPLQLLPSEPMRDCSRVMELGALKYGAWNWRTGQPVKVMTYVGAIRRHLCQFLDGEDQDDESGVSHLAHIMATCCILLDAAAVGQLADDRPPRPTHEEEKC